MNLEDQKMPTDIQDLKSQLDTQDNQELPKDPRKMPDTLKSDNQDQIPEMENNVNNLDQDNLQTMEDQVSSIQTKEDSIQSEDNLYNSPLPNEDDSKPSLKLTNTQDISQTKENSSVSPTQSVLEKEDSTPLDNYTPPVFEKPLVKSYDEARKLSDDDKMEDIEKRLFSIEDKVDHLLMHVGHPMRYIKKNWTPFGDHHMPNYHNNDTLNHKLTTIDYLFGGGGAGLGSVMGHPIGGFGGMHPMYGYGGYGGHMMGIGHNNPWGYGLDHVGGGWSRFDNSGYGRRANYPGPTNPYYTGSGSII
jgi:hypothetical protein